ncbi:MAG TPA: GTPase [Pirellulales bacterium]|nr:GTPase [Pirellulales bacterium]
MYRHDDTIAAIAATQGAARGIVRLSGPDVLAILTRTLEPCSATRLAEIREPTVISGHMRCGGARELKLPTDVYYWPDARSYTREPLAEIHTLGSPPLVASILARVSSAGARQAQPGEFTLRAFLAGRIDLTQAEAVLGVVDARGRRQFQHALAQLAGGLSRPLQTLRDNLLDLLADLEAGLDFVEDDIQFITVDEVRSALASAATELERLAQQLADRGDQAELPRIVLVGLPNVGKSSLFNTLAQSTALVSDQPGTTRDYLTALVQVGVFRCELVDTAGVESAAGTQIAAAASRRAKAERERADVELLCVDSSEPLPEWVARELTANPSGQRLVVLTKSDQPARSSVSGGIQTSSVAAPGTSALTTALEQSLNRLAGDGASSIGRRCAESIERAGKAIFRAGQANDATAGDELVAAEVRLALEELGKTVGAVYTEDLLDRIFSRFCIGK